MKKTLPIFIIVCLLVAGGAFFAGMKYGQSKGLSARNFANMTSEQRQQLMQRGGVEGFRGAGRNNGLVSGEIISKDNEGITVKLPDGGSKIIFFSESTEIGKFTQGTRDDLKIGETIMANGTNNSDGSITANNIQIRPDVPLRRNTGQ